MKKTLCLFVLVVVGLAGLGQGLVREGKVNEGGRKVGKHIWRSEESGLIEAEVIYDAEGHLLSYKTWKNGEIMDAEIAETQLKRAELPKLEFEFHENGMGFKSHSGRVVGAAKAASGQKVRVHYEGYLQDGTIFDSSYDRGKPLKFTLGKEQVIPGFEWGVMQLHLGEAAMILLPVEQGYGKYARGGVPPYAVLRYKIELLEIK